jgi:RNA polymerase-binding protein DksA
MPVPLERLKRELTEERKRLLEQLERPVVNDASEAIGYGMHQADHATEAFEQTKQLAIRQNTEGVLRRVEAALARFNDGTYGLCLQCGRPIDPARLEALQYAELCMDCQSKLERKGP